MRYVRIPTVSRRRPFATKRLPSVLAAFISGGGGDGSLRRIGAIYPR
jgi:hypothetical protein